MTGAEAKTAIMDPRQLGESDCAVLFAKHPSYSKFDYTVFGCNFVRAALSSALPIMHKWGS